MVASHLYQEVRPEHWPQSRAAEHMRQEQQATGTAGKEPRTWAWPLRLASTSGMSPAPSRRPAAAPHASSAVTSAPSPEPASAAACSAVRPAPSSTSTEAPAFSRRSATCTASSLHGKQSSQSMFLCILGSQRISLPSASSSAVACSSSRSATCTASSLHKEAHLCVRGGSAAHQLQATTEAPDSSLKS